MKNIEIKAKVGSDEAFENLLKLGRELSGKEPDTITQHDTFFNVPQGRLKLREENVSESIRVLNCVFYCENFPTLF
jgi:adenylate cyclase class IV